MRKFQAHFGIVLLHATLFLFATVQPVQAEEKILSFESQVQVFPDGAMDVTETITVRAERRQIKRGIYRDFPTRYKDRLGNNYVVDFEVKEVLKNGKPEPFHLKGQSNGERVYIGSSDVLLSPGIYKYTLKYRTNRQLGFFEEHDELYWNVTGNGWEFSIEQATARIVLPAGIPRSAIKAEAYTGYQGAQGRAYRTWDDGTAVQFETMRALLPREGLTIVVGWPKGFVAEPTTQQKVGYLFRDNRGLIVGVGGLGLVFLYYFLVWLAVGKDPEAGTIVPRYEPPQGLSPAAVRFIRRMGFDNKAYAVAIINMAVKGLLEIKKKKRKFVLHKQEQRDQLLFKEERKIYDKLPKTLELKNKNHSKISAAKKALKNTLAVQSEKIHFIKNTKYMIFGVIASGVAIIVMAVSESIEKTALMFFGIVWLSLWSVGVFAIGLGAWRNWKALLSGTESLVSVISAIFMTVIFLPFLAGEIAGIVMLGTVTSPGMVALLVLFALMNYLFYRWMKAPTHAGRKLLDEIEGFRMFLSVTERERLNLLHPPEKTPELFEKYLPYALALDVEQLWAEQFSDVLAQAGEGGQAYAPHWYHGRFTSGNYGALASSMASTFTSAIASASVAPGSRSGSSGGFSGGGSSGGGGGGGGGGGW